MESNRKPNQQYRANGGGRGGGSWYHSHNNNNNNSSYHGNRFHFRNNGQEFPDRRLERYEDELKRIEHDGVECDKLFEKLVEKLNNRQRQCAKLEAEMRERYNVIKVEAKKLDEEKKLVAKWKEEAEAAQEQADKKLEDARKEREIMERRSTDIAVQAAELEKAKKDFDRKKATEDAPLTHALVNVPAVAKRVPSHPDFSDVQPAKRMKRHPPERNVKRELVHAALQEDAPGLYELLDERGLLDDMEVITDAWSEDPSSPDDFKDLTSLISKHWGTSSNLVKDGRSKVQTASSWKPHYCLPCLVSLVEHTRVHKQRKFPVKWGWCRPLNAFLFVFEKHNRIVVERPEYGYATYFFELVHSLPVKWQVDRLIKVMSCVCNCRAALLENRPLEARTLLPEEMTVLDDYGWDPNLGVGTLLNFCDRVHHDYKTEDEAGEWKAKIGRLLMEGHDHAGIVVKIPRKLGGGGVGEASSSTEQGAPVSLLGLCTAKQETQQEQAQSAVNCNTLRLLVKQEHF